MSRWPSRAGMLIQELWSGEMPCDKKGSGGGVGFVSKKQRTKGLLTYMTVYCVIEAQGG